MIQHTFTQIPDAWSDPNFTLLQRYIVARILRFEENNQKYFMKRKDFCESAGIPLRTYDYSLNYLKKIGIVEVTQKTAKNISWLTINQDVLANYVQNGFPSKKDSAKMALEECNNGTLEVQTLHHDSAKMAPQQCNNGTLEVQKRHFSKNKQTIKQGNIQGNIQTKKETIKQTSEDNSFDDFRKEVTPKDELQEFMDSLDI